MAGVVEGDGRRRESSGSSTVPSLEKTRAAHAIAEDVVEVQSGGPRSGQSWSAAMAVQTLATRIGWAASVEADRFSGFQANLFGREGGGVGGVVKGELRAGAGRRRDAGLDGHVAAARRGGPGVLTRRCCRRRTSGLKAGGVDDAGIGCGDGKNESATARRKLGLFASASSSSRKGVITQKQLYRDKHRLLLERNKINYPCFRDASEYGVARRLAMGATKKCCYPCGKPREKNVTLESEFTRLPVMGTFTVGHLVGAMGEITPLRICRDMGQRRADRRGPRKRPVSRVLLCIDLTLLVLAEAVEKKCDAVVAYHPAGVRGAQETGRRRGRLRGGPGSGHRVSTRRTPRWTQPTAGRTTCSPRSSG